MSTRPEVEQPLRRLRELQPAKLLEPENIAKPHWREMTLPQLLDHLHGEIHELEEAMGALAHGQASPRDVAHEAADVANFAMMIIDVIYPEGD